MLAAKPVLTLLTLGVLLVTPGCAATRALAPAATPVDFSCQLPVSSPDTNFRGIIQFPGASFTPATAQGTSYDAIHQKWLPVLRQMVSPDRSSYVYGDTTKSRHSSIHVVDISSGSDRILWSEDAVLHVLGWSDHGITFVRDWAAAVPTASAFQGPELWILDPATSHPRLVVRQPPPGGGLPLFKAWTGLAAGAVWSKTVEDPPAPSGDVLVRVALSDGSVTTWVSGHKNLYLTVLGFEGSGHLYLAVDGPRSQDVGVWLLIAPDRLTRLQADGYKAPSGLPAQAGLADSHGVWLAGADGSIWLSSSGGPFQKVAQVQLPPAPQLDVGPRSTRIMIAGPCG